MGVGVDEDVGVTVGGPCVGVQVGAARVASSKTRVSSADTVAGTSSVLPMVMQPVVNIAAANSSANAPIAVPILPTR